MVMFACVLLPVYLKYIYTALVIAIWYLKKIKNKNALRIAVLGNNTGNKLVTFVGLKT